MKSVLPAATAFVIFGATASVEAAPVDAIRAADMQQMIPEVIAVYEDAGLSWDYGIEWKPGPFTTTYWYYDPNEDEIIVGAVPGDDQIEVYWQTWSDVLTDGNFDPASFFASESEARELARYNQYVLATHESAHAITFRYDYGHLKRHDWAINCREYYADRLTVAILNEQAAHDADMARWRERYLDLVVAMGDTIPEQYRYHIADFPTLDANCAVIDVSQPTPETMQPYASAYFERYRVLLEADLPSMADVFQTHLKSYHDQTLAALPLDPERTAYEISTRDGRLERARIGGDREDDFSRSRAAAFGPDGTLYFATLGYDSDTRMVSLEFGTDPAIGPEVGPPGEWHRPSRRLEITSLAVLSADFFIAALEHWEPKGDTDEAQYVVSWIAATRADNTWSIDVITEVEDMARAAVLRDPGGRIVLMATPEPTAVSSRSSQWVAIEIDTETRDVVKQLPVPASFDEPFAIDAKDRIYEAIVDVMWRSTPDGVDTVFAGQRLQGLRDGTLDKAELSYPEVLQWMADGTALVLDLAPGYRSWATREIRPVR